MRKLRSVVLFFFAAVASAFFVQEPASQAPKGIRVTADLELTLWACEPDVINPTNLDIDERGRIWVTEGVNYRRRLHHEPDYRDDGDRITILEDTDKDGRTDRVKVFIQDPAIRSPLGIAVLGDKVIVSQSPDILVFTKDENDRIVRRQVFLTGWGGEDHDHGVHSIVYGPDGYYYFNNGDQGLDVTDRSGTRIVSGPSEKYYAGSALRVRPDGTGLEVLGHNFRNPYELTIDSFGDIWQSDNDDDGNDWVRINYVLRGGNHGYWGPEGRRWQQDRGTHFHQEDPGVVPTVLRTGAGSPCGIVVYEGKLLPRRFWGNLLHVDNGPRLLRLYEIEGKGAGFELSQETIVEGLDTWFRPADVAVAPDGSVFIVDWYDAVVGGHQMKDTEQGRIYRLAPAGHRPRTPRVDVSTPGGRAQAMASPAQSIRYRAHARFTNMGEAAIPELVSLLENSSEDVLRARAFWLLGAAGPAGLEKVKTELRSAGDRFRVLLVRILREYERDLVAAVEPLLNDPSPAVRREIALALRDVPPTQARAPLLQLAQQYDGQDRWYLEALAIGAQGKEDQLSKDLLAAYGKKWNPALGKLLWVLRSPASVEFLQTTALDASQPLEYRIQAVEALGVQRSSDVGRFLADLIIEDQPRALRTRTAEVWIKQLFRHWRDLRQWPQSASAIRAGLRLPPTRLESLDLIADLADAQYIDDVLDLVSSSAPLEVRTAALETAGRLNDPSSISRFRSLLDAEQPEIQRSAVRALAAASDEDARRILQELILSNAPNEIRSEAVRALGRSERGLELLLDLAEQERLPAELQPSAVIAVNNSRNAHLQERARKVLSMLTTRDQEYLTLQGVRSFLLRIQGRVEEGRQSFFGNGQCFTCHNVGGGPEKMGPDLGAIGNKLGKEGLFDSIVNPSAGIAHEYVTWILKTRSDGEVRGMILADTPEEVTIRELSGRRRTIAKTDIVERRTDPISAMPNLVGLLTEQELADLIAYMETLK